MSGVVEEATCVQWVRSGSGQEEQGMISMINHTLPSTIRAVIDTLAHGSNEL